MTISDPNCDATFDVTNADMTAIDSGIFTFNPTTQILTIDTSDPLDDGDYELKLTASFVN